MSSRLFASSNYFNDIETVGLSRLKSHDIIFVTFQDNQTIFGNNMSIWTANTTAKFHQKIM